MLKVDVNLLNVLKDFLRVALLIVLAVVLWVGTAFSVEFFFNLVPEENFKTPVLYLWLLVCFVFIAVVYGFYKASSTCAKQRFLHVNVVALLLWLILFSDVLFGAVITWEGASYRFVYVYVSMFTGYGISRYTVLRA